MDGIERLAEQHEKIRSPTRGTTDFDRLIDVFNRRLRLTERHYGITGLFCVGHLPKHMVFQVKSVRLNDGKIHIL